jgi:outer membrane protein TolC
MHRAKAIVTAFAALAAGSGATGSMNLQLQEALGVALENNFSFRISRINPEIARDDVIRQEAVFDPEIFASGTVSGQRDAGNLGQALDGRSDNRAWEAGIRKRLAYGTTLTAQTSLVRSDRVAEEIDFSNLDQNADLSLSLRQPLLRGFGREANLAGVEGARAAMKASEESFRDEVLSVVAQTELAYWQVARWQEQLELDRSNLEVAETLLNEARERERVGLVTRIEVLQAEASRAQRLEEIIETTRSLGDAVDELLSFMGVLPGVEDFSMEPACVVTPLPDGGKVPGDFARAWELAAERDPLLAAQESVISQREFEKVAAGNSVRPGLDLVLSGGYLGYDDRYAGDAYDRVFEGDGYVWAAGIEFSLPWNLRGEKAALRSTDRRVQQETLRYELLKQGLYRDVRAAWRSLEAVAQSLEAASMTVSLQEATFEREKSKHEEGLSNFRDVLQAQSELDQARVRLLLAKYNKLAAEIQLSRLTGTLFDRHGLNPEF